MTYVDFVTTIVAGPNSWFAALSKDTAGFGKVLCPSASHSAPVAVDPRDLALRAATDARIVSEGRGGEKAKRRGAAPDGTAVRPRGRHGNPRRITEDYRPAPPRVARQGSCVARLSAVRGWYGRCGAGRGGLDASTNPFGAVPCRAVRLALLALCRWCPRGVDRRAPPRLGPTQPECGRPGSARLGTGPAPLGAEARHEYEWVATRAGRQCSGQKYPCAGYTGAAPPRPHTLPRRRPRAATRIGRSGMVLAGRGP